MSASILILVGAFLFAFCGRSVVRTHGWPKWSDLAPAGLVLGGFMIVLGLLVARGWSA